MDYYNISASYMNNVIGHVQEKMTPEEIHGFDRSLEVIYAEQMDETPLPDGHLPASISDD